MAASFSQTAAGHTIADTKPAASSPAAASILRLSSNLRPKQDPISSNRPTIINTRKHTSSSSRQLNEKSFSNNSATRENNGNNEDTSVLHHRQNNTSSKLPAFRLADLKKDALLQQQKQQQQQQQQHADPPSSSSAPTDTSRRSIESVVNTQVQSREVDQRHQHSSDQQDLEARQDGHCSPTFPVSPKQESRHTPASSRLKRVHTEPTKTPSAFNSSQAPAEPAVDSNTLKNRASASHAALAAQTRAPLPSSSTSNRPASLPDPTVVATQLGSSATSELQQQGASVIISPDRSGTTNSQQRHSRRTASDGATQSSTPRGQRELLLPKTVDTTKSDERRRSRPPISFRPPNIELAAVGRPVIPPIRSFRSSGSRKSLVLDMNTRRMSLDGSSDGYEDPNHRDRTLRALEGRIDDGDSELTPPDSAYATPAEENTADLFMQIASEDHAPETSPRGRDGSRATEEHSSLALSRLRSSQRRPFSAAVPTHQVSSPPQVTRRLSDQRETSRTRRLTNEQPAQQLTRELTYRTMGREQPPLSSASRVEEPIRAQSGRYSSLRPSPITPRTYAFQDTQSELGSSISRRRPSVAESSGGLPSASRASHLRSANLSQGQGKTYNSSPLVQRSMDVSAHQHQEANHAEGTGSSTASTAAAAPSMVWDELDDLKSRIRRLELTGKQPATSAQAMSRVSDERPATAGTNATTMSASPRRNARPVDEVSTTSSQREHQPILLSALSKTKDVVSNDVYSAMESAANDALALASMMGAPGQPGPISSGASTIGGTANLTDRQLRKKAESICRSLTELCLALTDEALNRAAQVALASDRNKENLVSPTTITFPSITAQRRANNLTDQTVARLNPTTPRAPSTLEQRRTTMLNPPVLSSPRFAQAPKNTLMDPSGAGRKSSLLISRTRRAGTEEPEEQSGRRSSLLLARSRRAGTEEPEDRAGRDTSLLRSRKGTIGDHDETEFRFRAPSRATTEVNHLRSSPRDYLSQQDAGSSALPRRRLPSSINSRLNPPSSSLTVSTPPASATGRRFLERHTPDRDGNNLTERLAESREARQSSLSQTVMMNRTSSISRRRDSAIPGISSSASHVGSYR